jgi:hypothetical protein
MKASSEFVQLGFFSRISSVGFVSRFVPLVIMLVVRVGHRAEIRRLSLRRPLM